MEWNRENLLFLSQLFPQTLSPVSELRRAAEKSLSEATDLPNYGLAVFGIVAELWGKMLDSIVTLVSRPEQKRVLYEPEMPDVGYTAAFVKLHSIGKKEEDPLSDIRDPKDLLASSVARLFSADPAKYTQIIGENLEQANQEALLQLCNAYNCKKF